MKSGVELVISDDAAWLLPVKTRSHSKNRRRRD